MVNQREVGADTKSFAQALKYALRQDPDVILVGEMRDLETIQAALTIAETGHLCLATLHTNSAAESINRIIDVFPSHQQSQVRAQLAFVLEGVVTQSSSRKSRGRGRAMAPRGHGVHAGRPRLHPRRQGPPDLLDHAGREEARHADAERLALPALHAARGGARRLPEASSDPAEFLRMVGESAPSGIQVRM
jgi:twitching motility protein PilT